MRHCGLQQEGSSSRGQGCWRAPEPGCSGRRGKANARQCKAEGPAGGLTRPCTWRTLAPGRLQQSGKGRGKRGVRVCPPLARAPRSRRLLHRRLRPASTHVAGRLAWGPAAPAPAPGGATARRGAAGLGSLATAGLGSLQGPLQGLRRAPLVTPLQAPLQVSRGPWAGPLARQEGEATAGMQPKKQCQAPDTCAPVQSAVPTCCC